MRKTFSLPPLVFALAFFGSATLLTGCDFGNKTNDTVNAGAEEGTFVEGDNADDEKADSAQPAQTDTVGVGSFQ